MWLAEIVENKVKRLIGSFETRQAANAAYWSAYKGRAHRRTRSPYSMPCVPAGFGVYPAPVLPFWDRVSYLSVWQDVNGKWVLRYTSENWPEYRQQVGFLTAAQARDWFLRTKRRPAYPLPCRPVPATARCSP
jgi:hypothetical protein